MVSDEKLIVCFRNFFRNKMVNLSARSVRYFLPNAEIHCLSLYKASRKEYKDQEPLLPFINEFKEKTSFVNKVNAVQDGPPGATSGYANPHNGKYFIEGYNRIFNKFKNTSEKVLILSEDHFFTTGKVLEELLVNEYDLAVANKGISNWGANGSILSFRPSKVASAFPLPEVDGSIEPQIGAFLMAKVDTGVTYTIEHRNWIDYCGDGIYTNSSEEMIAELSKAGII